ncbi:hypothetical protein HNQ07_001470 [Deinococcus metalli]|nr:hypothetical protein [Deinococcus metalli]MBB5376013.1 hypothetical protein [Deinococcus metalli]
MSTERWTARRLILRRLLTRGVLLALIAAGAGLGLGFVLGGHTLRAAFDGLNWASFALFGLSGMFGAGQIRLSPIDPVVLSSGAGRVPIEPLPWERIVVCVLAGLICGGLTFVEPSLLP